MRKVEFNIEYPLKKGSQTILWNSIGKSLGLSEWFADDVSVEDDQYTFVWDKHEQIAALQQIKPGFYIRFQWEEDEGTDAFFELKIITVELTGELILSVTDFAEADEVEDAKLLWNHQVEVLRRKTGM